MNCIRVGVGGFTSNAGKTTLVCELLRALSGWEAIKTTRGHYRSCGKDPHACCVSDLLGEEPLVLSGRAKTYAAGKDTGRYWDAGASNVHWVVATSEQVGRGVKTALGRVMSPGVIIEGNSPLNFVEFDFFLMVARFDGPRIKPTARRALAKADALYLSDVGEREAPAARVGLSQTIPCLSSLPVYTPESLTSLVEAVGSLSARVRAGGGRYAAELL